MIPERFLSRSIQLDEEDDFSMSPSGVLVAALPFFLLLLITFTIEVLPKDISIRLFDCLHQNEIGNIELPVYGKRKHPDPAFVPDSPSPGHDNSTAETRTHGHQTR